MKKRCKILALLLAIVMVAGSLTACSGQSDNKVETGGENEEQNTGDQKEDAEGGFDKELTIMHHQLEERRDEQSDYDAFFTMLERYQESHPDVTINQSAMVDADYETKIQAQAATGDLPDVFVVKGSWFENFVSNGLLAPLDDLINGYEKKDAYREGIFDTATVDGHIYGVPTLIATSSLVFYNEKLWKEAGYETFPDNWDDIYAAADKFNEMGISTLAFGDKDKWPAESCILSTLGDRYTGSEWTRSIIARDGKAKFTDPEFVSALQHLQDMSTKGLFNKDFLAITAAQGTEYYCQGNAAATITGFWDVANITANATDEVKENTKITVLPAVDGGKGIPNGTAGGCAWYLCMNSNLTGEKKALAEEFMLSIYGYEYSEYLAETHGVSGACQTEKVDISKFPNVTQEFLKCMDKVSMTPIYDNEMDGAVIEVMNSGIQELLNGTKDAQTLAEEIQTAQESLGVK